MLVIGGQVLDLLAYDESQLDLIVQVDAPGPDDGALAGQQQTGGGLQEEERLLRPRAVQLLDVVPNREAIPRELLCPLLLITLRGRQYAVSVFESSLTHSCGQRIRSCWG